MTPAPPDAEGAPRPGAESGSAPHGKDGAQCGGGQDAAYLGPGQGAQGVCAEAGERRQHRAVVSQWQPVRGREWCCCALASHRLRTGREDLPNASSSARLTVQHPVHPLPIPHSPVLRPG